MPIVIEPQDQEVMTWKECQYLLGTKVGEVGFFSLTSTSHKPTLAPATFAFLDGNLYISCCDPTIIESAQSEHSGNTGSLGVISLNSAGSHLSWSVQAQGAIELVQDPSVSDWAGNRLSDQLEIGPGSQVLKLALDSLTGYRYKVPTGEEKSVLASPSETMAATITSI